MRWFSMMTTKFKGLEKPKKLCKDFVVSREKQQEPDCLPKMLSCLLSRNSAIYMITAQGSYWIYTHYI